MKTFKIKDVCHLEKGQQIDTSLLNDIHPYKYINGGMKESGYYTLYNTEGETVLVSEGGASCGYVNYINERFWCGCHCYKLTQCKILPKYLYYALKGNQNKLMALRTGSAMPNIKKASLQEMKLKINEDFLEQKDTVKKLDLLQSIITHRRQQLAKLDGLVKSQFMEQFGDPVTNTQEREVRPFKDFMLGIRYGTSQPPIFSNDGEFKFIRATNIKAGRITETDMLRISANEASKIEKCKLDGDEILIVRSGANTGDTCIVTSEYRNQYAGYDIIITLNPETANPVFFNELMNTHYMQAVIKPLTVRAAQPHINSEQIQNLPMIAVPLPEQEQFAAFVRQSDRSKFVVQKALDQAQLLFDSLMQKYFK